MTELNPRQLQAVRHVDGPLLVIAGAGSGKTRVITHKIVYLIRQCGLSSQHILALTFTNKAAREMRERVGAMTADLDTRGLAISTFHHLGLRILKEEYRAIGYRPGFSILDQADAETLLRELLRQGKGSDPERARAALWRISAWKHSLISPAEALSQAGDALEAGEARLYADYQRQLEAYNALDFDDLIRQPVGIFRANPDILDRWQNRVRYLLVDEYQDTDVGQYELVRHLVGIRQAFSVVGDDDQSIYSWRGARPENMARLQQDFPRLKVITLEQNYRSSRRILNCANSLIGRNSHLFEKRLWSEFGLGDPLRVLACRDEEHEARRVVSEILRHRFTKSRPYSDYAILYRSNHQSRPFEKVLREQNVPYFLSGGTSFFARSEIKDAMAYLRLLSNPADDAAYLRIVNVPRREIGPITLEKLAGYAAQRHQSLLDASRELGLGQYLDTRSRERLQIFARLIETYSRRAVAPGDGVETVRQLLRDLHFEAWIQETSAGEVTARRRLEYIEDLLNWIGRLQGEEGRMRSLADIIGHLALMDLLERQDEAKERDSVHLMTLHAAKGLEFPYVFLVGMEEDRLPHRNSIESGDIEEERRLAYVGLTRAQRDLTLSWVRQRKRIGGIEDCRPSRFLEELPQEHLEWEGAEPGAHTEQQRARNAALLSGLKALLS